MLSLYTVLFLLANQAVAPPSTDLPSQAAAVQTQPPVESQAPAVPAPPVPPPALPSSIAEAPPAVVVAPEGAPALPRSTIRFYGDALASYRRGVASSFMTENNLRLGVDRLGVGASTWLDRRVRASGALEIGPGGDELADASHRWRIASGRIDVRQLYVLFETPIVDALAGVTWYLFGAGETYRPATWQLRGVPGQLATRDKQVRLSHAFRGRLAELEIAAGAAPGPASQGSPNWQGRVRFVWNGLRGIHTAGPGFTQQEPLSISLSGLYRSISATEHPFDGATRGRDIREGGVSLDFLVPIIATACNEVCHALTLTGSVVVGVGIGRLLSPATRDVLYILGEGPPSPVGYDIEIDRNGNLRSIEILAMVFGLQYRPPPKGLLWASVNYSRAQSNQGGSDILPPLGSSVPPMVQVFQSMDLNLFVDPIHYLRVGVHYQWLDQSLDDGTSRRGHRFLLTVLAMFP